MGGKALSVVMVLGMGLSGAAYGSLIDQGDGTVLDTELGTLWLKNANLAATETFGVSGIETGGYMDWATANAWIGSMNTAIYLGHADWRLPRLEPVNGGSFVYTTAFDGSTDDGWNLSADDSAYPRSKANEMAFLFYQSLPGNLGRFDVYGNYNLPLINFDGLRNRGPFENLLSAVYWAGTDTSQGAGFFYFQQGSHGFGSQGSKFSVWAVRDADVAIVPVPAPLWLIGAGFLSYLGLGFSRRRT